MAEEERLRYKGMIRERGEARRLASRTRDATLAREAISFFDHFALSRAGNHYITLYRDGKERRFIIIPSRSDPGRFVVMKSVNHEKPSRVLAPRGYASIDEAKQALWNALYLKKTA